jgi:hypothetical protein
MTPCSVPPPRQAAASWRLDLHPGCQDTRQRPWPASFTNRVLDRSSAFLWLPVGRLPAGSQLGRVVLKQLFLQPPTQRRTLAKAPESCPSPPSADGRVLPSISLARAAAAQRIAGIQCRVTVGSVRVWPERSARRDRSSEARSLMMYFHRSTSGKLSRPLPFHCREHQITKRGPPMRRIAWERKN